MNSKFDFSGIKKLNVTTIIKADQEHCYRIYVCKCNQRGAIGNESPEHYKCKPVLGDEPFLMYANVYCELPFNERRERLINSLRELVKLATGKKLVDAIVLNSDAFEFGSFANWEISVK